MSIQRFICCYESKLGSLVHFTSIFADPTVWTGKSYTEKGDFIEPLGTNDQFHFCIRQVFWNRMGHSNPVLSVIGPRPADDRHENVKVNCTPYGVHSMVYYAYKQNKKHFQDLTRTFQF